MPEASLSGIEFEIKGSTDAASQSVFTLSQKLLNLSKILSDSSGIKSFAKAINSLAKAVDSINGKNVSDIAKKFETLATAMAVFEPLKDTARAMGTFGNGMGRLAKNAEGLADVGAMLATIADIDFDGIVDGVTALGRMANSLSKLAQNTEGLEKVVGLLERIAQIDFSNIASAAEGIKDLATVIRQIEKTQNKEKVEEVVGKPAIFRTILGKTFDWIGGKATQLLNWAAKAPIALGMGMVKGISIAAKGAWGILKGLTSAAKGIGKVLIAPFKSGITAVKGFVKGLGQLFSSFKRIAMYRLMRSAIKAITQGFQEGIKNLYGWSTLVNGKFKTSMDTISTSMGYFKNSLGAMVAPIVNALAPAIDFLIDKIVALINVINQLFALLSGAGSWTMAIKKAKEYEDAAGGAGGAAKEALKYLAPFDELNRLPDENKGGGGGGASEDYSNMFEEVTEFNEALADFADSIRTAVENSDWQGLGEILGNKINELIDMIDFANLGAKVGGYINAWFTTRYWTLDTVNFTNIGAKIAEFFNNALENIDFEIIGRTVIQKFAILGDLIIGALGNIDWALVVSSIADFIKGYLNEAEEWFAENDVAGFVQSLYQNIKIALGTVDWEDIARSLLSLLETAFSLVLVGVEIANDIVNDLDDAIKNIDFTEVGKLLAQKFNKMLENVDFDGLISLAIDALTGIGDMIIGAITNIDWELVGKQISTIASNAFNKIADWIENVDWAAVADSIVTAVENIEWGDVLSAIFRALGASIGAATELITQLAKGIFTAIKNAITSHITDDNGDGKISLSEILGGIINLAESLGEWIDKNISAPFWRSLFTTLLNVELEEELTTVEIFEKVFDLSSIDEWVTENIKEPLVEAIKRAFTGGVGGVIGVSIYDWIFGGGDSGNPSAHSSSSFSLSGTVEITDVIDSVPNNKKTISNMVAEFKSRKLGDGFNNVIGNMMAQFQSRRLGSGFNKIIGNMIAEFTGKVKGANFISTIDDMKALFRSHDKGSGFVSSIGDMIAIFSGRAKSNNFNSSLSGMIAVLSKFTKATNFSNAITGLIGYLTSVTKGWASTPLVEVIASLISPRWKDDITPTMQVYQQTVYKPPVVEGGSSGLQGTFARGGVFSNGVWHSIPQYARGGRVHGSLFLAGEQGSELVGHIGGRTEVLNRSQLAATMYAAVRSAIASTGFKVSGVSAMAASVPSESGNNEEAMYRAMLRALNDSDVGDRPIELDGTAIYKSVVKRNRLERQRTGMNPMLSY